jgi:hypothetical protein
MNLSFNLLHLKGITGISYLYEQGIEKAEQGVS